jgi:hypothetical protein
VITVENHHVSFSGINNDGSGFESARKWKGPKPQSNSDFLEISKQFENIGNA